MNRTLFFCCALALSGVAGSALAAEGSAGFVRAEIGSGDVEVSGDGFRASDRDTATVLAGGYWFNRHFAVEGRVGSLFRTDFADSRQELDLQMLGVGVAGKYGFGADGTGFFVGGRAGMARIDVKVNDSDFEADSTKPYLGVNAGYDFSERWGLSLDYGRYQADLDVNDLDIDAVTVGGEFRF